MEFQSEVSLCIILHEVVYLYFFMIFYFKDVTYCVIMDSAKWHNKRECDAVCHDVQSYRIAFIWRRLLCLFGTNGYAL